MMLIAKVSFAFLAVFGTALAGPDPSDSLEEFGDRILKASFCSAERLGAQCGTTKKKNGDLCECIQGDDDQYQCVKGPFYEGTCTTNEDCPKKHICASDYCEPLCPHPLKATAKFPACSKSNIDYPCGLSVDPNNYQCACLQINQRKYGCMEREFEGISCSDDSDCPDKGVGRCIDSTVCDVMCQADSDCGDKRLCVFYVTGGPGICTTKCFQPF